MRGHLNTDVRARGSNSQPLDPEFDALDRSATDPQCWAMLWPAVKRIELSLETPDLSNEHLLNIGQVPTISMVVAIVHSYNYLVAQMEKLGSLFLGAVLTFADIVNLIFHTPLLCICVKNTLLFNFP